MANDSYGPALGADARSDRTRFALWTSRTSDCAVRLFESGKAPITLKLEPEGDGIFSREVAGAGHATRYAFVLDGAEIRDPYAKFLPDGVMAPAMVWESRYAWKNPLRSRPVSKHVIYELHVGTFTPEGTYRSAAARLPELVELGVTALELMPIGAFPGSRGWGYDGVAHFAPFAPYGNPDELRAFIDRAHELGLSVFLDVVYNHFGPSGNVMTAYGSEYFTTLHETPWGDAPNFEHPAMRRYVVRNVRYWLEEFRFDGLRFDAVHAIPDDSPTHILREVATETAKLSPKRLLIAEDDRNDPAIIEAHGLDAVWADDFHHQVRVGLTGEHDGYYAAYSGSPDDLAETIEGGWFYRGQTYPPTGEPRGKPAPNLDASAFVYCIQNHDQIGNRAFGDRLTDVIPAGAFAAMTMLLLFVPATPLVFMGQEWGATTPFLYFTDHYEGLGRLVTEGRRKEFARFRAFADEEMRSQIPDPQAESTFERSKLDWAERSRAGHATIFALYRAMLRLRASDPVLSAARRDQLRAHAVGGLLVVERWLDTEVRSLLVNLGDDPAVPVLEESSQTPRVLLTTNGRIAWGTALEKHTALLIGYERVSR